MEDYFRRLFFVRTFADGNENNEFSQATEKNEFFHLKISKRDLTIGDVAHARHTENKLSSALANSQHCIVFFSYCYKPAWEGLGGGRRIIINSVCMHT